MQYLIFILLIVSSIYGHTKFEKMSLNTATQVLKLMDEIEKTNDITLKITFKELTNEEYHINLRQKLYDVIHKNANYTSISMKLAGLITFQTVIYSCMIVVAIIFMCLLFKDLILFLGSFSIGFALFLMELLLEKKFMNTFGILYSIVFMYVKPDEIENVYLRYLFIFDWLSPLFGCIIFGIFSFKTNNDFIHENSRSLNKRFYGGYDENSNVCVGLFVTFVWGIITIYHQNWLIGVATILMLFFSCGFLFGPIFGGYAAGYETEGALMRCFIVSCVLNAIMVGIKCEFITGPILKYTQIFDSGIYFVGTFVGCLSLLIRSGMLQMGDSNILLTQLSMFSYCLTLMYIGSVLYVDSYKSIGGTFLVLWGMDMEQYLLRKISSGNKTIMCGIALATLYVIKQLSVLYPEYCIF